MGWWPFGRGGKIDRAPMNDPLLKDNRILISELRDVCELNFDNPERSSETNSKDAGRME